MITISTTFLGLEVTALCFHDPNYGWLVDDIKVTNAGYDMWEHLARPTLRKLADHVRDQAVIESYKGSSNRHLQD